MSGSIAESKVEEDVVDGGVADMLNGSKDVDETCWI